MLTVKVSPILRHLSLQHYQKSIFITTFRKNIPTAEIFKIICQPLHI